MIKPKIVAIIPSREESERCNFKNKRIIMGKPLICHTIDVALEVSFLDEIIVATDDPDILEICAQDKYNVPKFRSVDLPTECTRDNSSPVRSLEYVGKAYNSSNTVIVWLQPTSPLRTKSDIILAYNIFLKANKHIGVVPVSYKYPELTMKLCGLIFIDWLYSILVRYSFIPFNRMICYVVPEERAVDIDTMEDFVLAEKYFLKRLENAN